MDINITEMATATQSAFRMPLAHRSTFAPAGGVSAVAVAAKPRLVGATAVCGHVGTDAVAIKGAFPGTSAWSPPI